MKTRVSVFPNLNLLLILSSVLVFGKYGCSCFGFGVGYDADFRASLLALPLFLLKIKMGQSPSISSNGLYGNWQAIILKTDNN